MKKQKIALMLTIAMAVNGTINLIPNVPHMTKPVLAATQQTYIYENNFDSYVGSTQSNVAPSGMGAYNTVAGSNYLVGEKVDGAATNSLKYYTSTSGSNLEIAKYSLALKNKIVLDADVRMESTDHERAIFIIRNGSTAYLSPVVFTVDGKIINRINNKELGTYTTSKWYNVKVVVDSPNKLLNIYIDNQKVDIDVPLLSTWTQLDTIKVSQKPIAGKTGVMYFDNLKIYDFVKDFGNATVDSVSLNQTSATVNINETVTLVPSFNPSDAANKNVTWTSSNPAVASVDANGVVTGVKGGQATITVTTEDGGKTATCDVTVNGVVNIPVSGITMEKDLTLERGKTAQLNAVISPVDATNKNITWTSSKPHIASVDANGVVTANEKGTVTVTATTEDGAKTASCNIEVKYMVNTPQVEATEYDRLRQNWFNEVTGGNYDLTNANVQRVLTNVSNTAQTNMSTMNKDASKPYLWSNLNNFAKSATIRSSYLNLEAMAKAYVMEGSTLKGDQNLLNDIIYGMEWLYDNQYNENKKVEFDNWWDWEIGIPQSINNIGVLLYNELKGEKLDKYMRAVYFYQPDPFHSGYTGLHPNPYRESEAANRVDVAKIAAVMGILTQDPEQVIMARDAISSVLQYTESLDGFYKDGSFLQHGTVPYVGTYGNVFINGTGTLIGILKGSNFQIPQEKLTTLYNFVIDSFEPFIYKSAALDMVRGRGISRFKETDRQSGHGILNSIVILSRFAEEPYASHFKSIAKYWMLVDTTRDHVGSLGNMALIKDCENILKDSAITPEVQEPMHKNFAMMDRVIHRTADYLFGVSMFSTRVTNFECMNSENKRGWHTTDGMTYLYNNDLEQYSVDYWPTVNPYRLPGTTVDTVKMTDGKGNKVLSDKDWVGGTSIGNYGINGMDLRGVGPTGALLSLEAKKSWFMFDDEIVALGAGINSTDSRTIESIVDNRKLKDDNTNTFVVDGQDKGTQLGTEETINDAKWAYLSGNVAGADMGYYFPKAQTVKTKRVQNTGTWQAIGSSGPVDASGQPQQITKNYLEMWFDHGANPQAASYEYVVLPNKSQADTEAYAANPQITVLQNTSEVQAVKQNKLNIIGANFFTDSVQTVEGITVNKKASVMVQETEDYIEVSVSDPTMKNVDGIEVTIDKANLQEFTKDANITVNTTSDKINFVVDTKDAKGQSAKIRFTKKKVSNLDNLIKEAQGLYDSAVVGEEAGNYTQASKDDLKVALDAAVLVFNNAASTQAQIDAAYDELRIAKESFEASVIVASGMNEEEVNSFIEEVSKTEEKAYVLPNDESSLDLVTKLNENNLGVKVELEGLTVNLDPNALDLEKYKDNLSKFALTMESTITDNLEHKDFNLIGKVYDIKLIIKDKDNNKEQVHKLKNKAKVKLSLTNEEIKNIKDMKNLRAYYYNEETKQWEEVSVVTWDESTNTFSFQTTHFSKYAIMEKVASSNTNDNSGNTTGGTTDNGGTTNGGNSNNSGTTGTEVATNNKETTTNQTVDTKETAVKETKDLPKTGSMFGFGSLIALGGAMIGLGKKKFKK